MKRERDYKVLVPLKVQSDVSVCVIFYVNILNRAQYINDYT